MFLKHYQTKQQKVSILGLVDKGLRRVRFFIVVTQRKEFQSLVQWIKDLDVQEDMKMWDSFLRFQSLVQWIKDLDEQDFQGGRYITSRFNPWFSG